MIETVGFRSFNTSCKCDNALIKPTDDRVLENREN